MNKLLLKMVLLPKGIWTGLGADLEQLRAILRVKLILDDRKPMQFGRQQPKKNAKYSSALTMLLSFFTGLIYMLPLLLAVKDAVFALCIFYTLFLFFLTFTLITDFSNVMVDTRDKYVIFSRPVNDRTVFLLRMLHIFIYLFRIVLPMSVPGWVTFTIIKGWKAAIWFPFPLLLMIMISLFLVNAIYLLLIKLTKPGRFKEIINYFQIAFSILFFASYYLLPRFMDSEAMTELNVLDFTWVRGLPSYWLAATWSWIEPGVSLAGTGWLGLLALVFPFLCTWVTVKFLAPNFIKNITALDGVDSEEGKPVAGKVAPKKQIKLYSRLARLLNRSDEAKAGFIMTWLQTSRSRTFKMRVFPLFAYVPVYFVYLMYTSKDDFGTVWEALPGTQKHLLLLYMSAFVLLQALNYVTMSDQYKAAWVYYSAPVEVPGHIMIGAFKAMWVKYFLPFIGAISAFVLFVWGGGALLDVILAMANVTLFALCIMRIAYRSFPFSMIEQMNSTGVKAMIRVTFTFFLIGALGFGHYLATFVWLKLIFLVLSLILLWLIWESYRSTSWNNLNNVEDIA